MVSVFSVQQPFVADFVVIKLRVSTKNGALLSIHEALLTHAYFNLILGWGLWLE